MVKCSSTILLRKNQSNYLKRFQRKCVSLGVSNTDHQSRKNVNIRAVNGVTLFKWIVIISPIVYDTLLNLDT